MATEGTPVPRLTPRVIEPPSMVPGWARWLWRFVRGLCVSRVRAAETYVKGVTLASRAAEFVVKAEGELRAAQLELSSARAVIQERDREILLLRREKAQTEGERDLRIQEVEELNEWLERHRQRVRADTATEVAREQAALAGGRKATPNNSPPS